MNAFISLHMNTTILRLSGRVRPVGSRQQRQRQNWHRHAPHLHRQAIQLLVSLSHGVRHISKVSAHRLDLCSVGEQLFQKITHGLLLALHRLQLLHDSLQPVG